MTYTSLLSHRHLDDLHQNLEEVEQDEVKDWFKTQLTKAQKFQPLALLNQKFKGLDVFESNDPPAPATAAAKLHTRNQSSSGKSTPEPSAPVRVQDPDEMVTRTHWQRPSYNDACADPMCGKRLGGSNGSVNCRKCGALYCEEHTMYQMKLSRSAAHEPIRGVWCRVCETCYKSREGYNDHRGLERNHTDVFVKMRRAVVDKQYLEISRLEKRLSKLTQLLASPPAAVEETNGGGWRSSLFGSVTGQSQQKALEQTVITWEDDASVKHCPFCQQEFTNYTFRRHHCRTCGRVVCGDPKTDCSANLALDVARPANPAAEKPTQPQTVPVSVRLCKDCRHTLFAKHDFEAALAQKPPDQVSYENLSAFQRGIRLLLPRFQTLLQALQDADKPPSKAQIDRATKTRKRLTDSFVQYQVAAVRIRDLPMPEGGSRAQERLQKAVYKQAMSFLHLHMLPLKALPKILKHATPNGNGAFRAPSNGKNALATIAFNRTLSPDTASQSSRSSAIESLEAEEKQLKEVLILLEEQKFIVGEALADARRKRRFEDVRTLVENVEELGREVDAVQKQLEGLDFAGVYSSGVGD